jgi:MoxR-like ATPase
MSEPTLRQLQDRIETVFVGKTAVVERALIALLSGGHLLIEDVPGVGKTTLALALARAIGCTFQRIQFTSDMLPSDILGVSILNNRTQAFEFHPGPIFHQVILADELNRATPRTQGALLECMNERQVSLDGVTHVMPSPFFVLATQNPQEHHGTFPLPESQLDRFTMRISIGYPSPQDERRILTLGSNGDAARHVEPLINADQMRAWTERVREIHVASPVDDYLLSLVEATRCSEEIAVGVSPRGAIALRRAAQGRAFLQGRDHVTTDDVKVLALSVLAHRLVLSNEVVTNFFEESENVMARILQQTPVPL